MFLYKVSLGELYYFLRNFFVLINLLELIVNKNTQDLSRYKKILRDLKITHQQVADYTGSSREHITVLLNGRRMTTIRNAAHISGEIEEMIADKKQNLK